MQTSKITGFNANSYNLSFGRKMYDAKTICSSPVVEFKKALELIDKMNQVSYLFNNGIPDKVVFAYDDEYTFATVKLYNKKDSCIMTAEVLDEDVEACTELFLRNGVKPENIQYWDIVKGEGKIVPPKKYTASNKAMDFSELDIKEQVAIRKALINLQKRSREPLTLKSPIIFNDDEKKYKMSYVDFLARTYGSRFDFNTVLDNLNASTADAFESENIEYIIVTPDGTMMEIRAKDGGRAFMDFNTGKRRVFDKNVDCCGFGNFVLMDNYGPIIKQTKNKAEKKQTEQKAKYEKAANKNQSLFSKLLKYLGVEQNGRHFRK